MNEWFDDFKTAVAFLTRLPMPHPDGAMPQNFVRAHRMFPVVGALIGAVVGLLCLGLRSIGVPDLAAAAQPYRRIVDRRPAGRDRRLGYRLDWRRTCDSRFAPGAERAPHARA